MNHSKLKLLGLAVSAMLVLGATWSSAASAAEFHSSIHHAILKGAQSGATNDSFTIDAGTWECNKVTYEGTISKPTTEEETATTTVSLRPTYSECTATFGLSIIIHPNGCEYVLHAAASHTVDIQCPAGKSIETTAPGCVVTFGPQTGLTGTTFTNARPHVTIDLTVLSQITYVEHNKGFFPTCAANTLHKTNGSYLGKATIEAYDTEGAKKEIWFE